MKNYNNNIIIVLIFISVLFVIYKLSHNNKEGFTPTIRRSYHSNLRKLRENFNNNILNSGLVKGIQKKTNNLMRW